VWVWDGGGCWWCFAVFAWKELGWEDYQGYQATKGSDMSFQDIDEFNLTFHDQLTFARDQGSP